MGSAVSNPIQAVYERESDRDQEYSFDATSKPPPFGHQLKKYWAFEKDFVNLNHGSYGSLPLPVMAQCSKLSLQSEQNPDKFHRFEYMSLLDECRWILILLSRILVFEYYGS